MIAEMALAWLGGENGQGHKLFSMDSEQNGDIGWWILFIMGGGGGSKMAAVSWLVLVAHL